MKLSKRLSAAANLIRQGARLADIGCDHGYVPVYLIENGKISSAVASDINEGPLASCKRLVKENKLEDNITCVLSNGLEKVNLDEVDDILIAGMGGELISEILSNCDISKLKEKHIILNPMTHPEIARQFLFDNGFGIQSDIIVKDKKHYYSIFDCVYTGKTIQYSKTDLFLGKIEINQENEGYFLHLLNYLRNKQKSGGDFSEVISAVEEKINDNR
ncbi:MAG: SAM-dependent methyltransferase [Ruminococcaceae bacterium]|nr:SAM-dependent methyltransferase [Oscillospiraceae bacterium]